MVRRGQAVPSGATPHCSDKVQVKSMMLYLTSGASVTSGLGNNGALGGTGLLEKEQQSVETKELSLG